MNSYDTVSPAQVKAVRGFNRFYTQQIGILAPYLSSDMSLTEVRVLYELAHRDQPTASELGSDLALDAGYLSRILRRFEQRGWLARVASPADARQNLLELTAHGRAAFEPLQQKSHDEAAALLGALSPASRGKLLDAMATMQQLLEGQTQSSPPRTVLLREPLPGDLGWVVQQHGEIYAREYGWNLEFESLVATIAGEFAKKFQPQWERCWIAEVDGQRAGSIFVARKSTTVAQLRMLILTPQARGLGLGARLTEEAIAFARGKGYRKMVLWTHGNLLAARHIYAAHGFKRVKSVPYRAYGGHALIGETWALRL